MFTIRYAGCNVTGENYTKILKPYGSGDFLFVCFLTHTHVTIGDRIETARPGACILYTPGTPQHFDAVRDFRFSFVQYDAPADEANAFGLPENSLFYPKDPENVLGLLKEIHIEYFTQDLYCSDIMHALLLQLFACLARDRDSEALEKDCERKLYRLFCEARYTILSNCEKEWNSANMSEMVSLARSQFYKYYSDFFGTSPIADLNIARIEKARHLLADRNLQVAEVAERCGYSGVQQFSRAFKERTGMSPLAYVKSLAPQE